MEYWVETGLRPLRHYADFRGRATRSELVAFYILTSVLSATVAYVAGMFSLIFGEGAWRIGQVAAQLLFLCPTLALSVRRLHDQGKSAFWLALLLPGVAANLWQFYAAGFTVDPFAELEHPIPVLAKAIAAVPLLVFLVLLLWKDQEGTNRYGPNPRYDEPIDPDPTPDAVIEAGHP